MHMLKVWQGEATRLLNEMIQSYKKVPSFKAEYMHHSLLYWRTLNNREPDYSNLMLSDHKSQPSRTWKCSKVNLVEWKWSHNKTKKLETSSNRKKTSFAVSSTNVAWSSTVLSTILIWNTNVSLSSKQSNLKRTSMVYLWLKWLTFKSKKRISLSLMWTAWWKNTEKFGGICSLSTQL